MFALVSPDNVIIDIVSTTFDHVAPQLRWEELPQNSNAEIGFILKNNLVINPRIPDLAAAIRLQTKIVSSACQHQINGGFESSVLGATYLYASDTISQQNITQASQSLSGGLLSCSINNMWQKLQHSPQESQAVLSDFIKFKDELRLRLDQIIQEINAYSSIEKVMSVNW